MNCFHLRAVIVATSTLVGLGCQGERAGHLEADATNTTSDAASSDDGDDCSGRSSPANSLSARGHDGDSTTTESDSHTPADATIALRPVDEHVKVDIGPSADPIAPSSAAIPLADSPIGHDIRPHVAPVRLTDSLAASCLVGVGDPFPKLALADLDGEPVQLADRLGKVGTVVVFLGASNFQTDTLAEDLEPDIATPFLASGVNVAVVAVGLPEPTTRTLAKTVGAKVEVLTDPEGAAFAQVASSHLPRVYLLRADGVIAWFDLEYSRSTRRELRSAVAALVSDSRKEIGVQAARSSEKSATNAP